MASIFLTHADQAREQYYGTKALAALGQLGEVRLNETGEPLETERLVELAAGCAIIVSDRQTPGPAGVFKGLPELVAFVRCAVDVRNIDLTAASAHGVLVTRASPGFIDSVAELAVGFMVSLARGVASAALAYHCGEPPEVRMGRQLAGSTLGIIGYGSIGRRLAALGQALRMQVLIHDPYVTVAEPGVAQLGLEPLLAQADFVVCLAVATEETENLIGAPQLQAMKPSAFLINVARGNLVDEPALEAALRDGRIAGCAMDVGRDPDQMPTPHIARLGNVVATPHIGGLVPEAIEHQALETTRQVAAILKGQAPEGALNADRATRLARLK